MRYVTVIFSLIALGMASGCWNNKDAQSGPLVINVLSEQLYNDCHIPGSINIPFEKFDINKVKKEFPLTTEIVIYCSDYQCTASDYIAKKLTEAGFAAVSVLRAGTAGWYQDNYPVNGPCKQGYIKAELKPLKSDEQDEIAIISTHDLAKKLNLLKK